MVHWTRKTNYSFVWIKTKATILKGTATNKENHTRNNLIYVSKVSYIFYWKALKHVKALNLHWFTPAT